MKRTATYLMSAALGTMVLATSTAAYAQMELPLAALGAALLAKTGTLPAPSPAPAPLMTGRSVATGQTGNFCSTPVKTCELRRASYIGVGCSCHVPGGRARGSVTP